MLLNELFSRLGLSVDEASWAKGALAAKGVEFALNKVAEAAKFVTDQLKEATFGVFASADKLDDLATKTGVSAQTLQELGYAGKFTDTSMESLSQGLRILQRNMVGAIEGNADLKKAFQSLGVSLVDSTGHARSTEDVFGQLADAFERVPEGAKRTELMQKLLGKSGSELTGVMKLGSKGIREQAEELRSLGGVMSGDLIAGSSKFEDNLVRLKTAFSGVQNTIAEAVLPAFNDIAQSAVNWAIANKDLIRVKVKEWVNDIVATVRYWVDSISDWVKAQGGFDAALQKAEHWLKILGIAFAVFETLSFVSAIGNAITALTAIKAAIAANPIGLLIVLLTTAVTLWIENWDDIREFFEFVWDRITGGLSSLGEWFAAFGAGLYAALVQPFVDTWAAITKIWDDGVKWIERKLARLGEIVADAAEILNPFNTEGDTRGTRGATEGGSAAEDAAFLAQRNALAGPGISPSIDNSRGGSRVSVVSSPQINITTQPGQSNEEIGRIVADHVDRHAQRTWREAAGGI